MKSEFSTIAQYLITELGAIELFPDEEDLAYIKRRVIINQYADLVLEKAQKLPRFSGLSKAQILSHISLASLLQEVSFPLDDFDIHLYKLRDGCIVEIDMVSKHVATIDDRNSWMDRIRNKIQC